MINTKSNKLTAQCLSVAGQYHIDKDIPCQDSCSKFIDNENGIGIVSVADGAGSVENSQIASSTVTKAVIAYFQNHTNLNKAELICFLNKMLSDNGFSASSTGSTLLFAVITDNRYIVGHIGDGAVIMRKNGAFSVLSYPENGAKSNETYFLPCADNDIHFRIYEGENANGFVLATDGISSMLYNQNGDISSAVEKFFRFSLQSSEKFESTVSNAFNSVFAKYSFDDKSIAVIRKSDSN